MKQGDKVVRLYRIKRRSEVINKWREISEKSR